MSMIDRGTTAISLRAGFSVYCINDLILVREIRGNAPAHRFRPLIIITPSRSRIIHNNKMKCRVTACLTEIFLHRKKLLVSIVYIHVWTISFIIVRMYAHRIIQNVYIDIAVRRLYFWFTLKIPINLILPLQTSPSFSLGLHTFLAAIQK